MLLIDRRIGRDQDFGQKVSDGFLRAAAGKGRSYTFVGVEVESNLVFCVSVSNLSPSTSSSTDDDDVDGRRPTSAQKLLLVPQHLSFSGRSTEISVATGELEKKKIRDLYKNCLTGESAQLLLLCNNLKMLVVLSVSLPKH